MLRQVLTEIVSKPKPLRRLHILFVDDDIDLCTMIYQTLRSEFEMRFAVSVTEAKLSLESAHTDILVSEVRLNYETGLDLCRVVRSSAALRHMPIMLVTPLASLQDKVAGFDAGADDYVVKPLNMRHLTGRVRLLSRVKRLE